MTDIMKVGDTINAKETMSSLEIAELTGKQHSHVMRDIRNMIDSLNKSNESTSGLVDYSSDYHRSDRTQYKYLSEKTQSVLLNFCFKTDNKSASEYLIYESSYKDAKGEIRNMYVLNKKACFLLASGYDTLLRAKIIDRWEELELEKRQELPKLPRTFAEALRLAAEQAEQLEKQQARIEEMKPKEEFFDQVTDSKDACDMATVAKVLNMGIGRNKLFEILRDNKILQGNNQPMQRYVDSCWFRVIETQFTKPNGDICINFKTIVYQKGIEGIRKLLTSLGYKKAGN